MHKQPKNNNKKLMLFISYSHKDEEYREELVKHLKIMKRKNIIEDWDDRRIGAGSEWKNQINDNIKSADVILLLISSDFLASDYCYEKEMKLAIERHNQQEACVIPIILRDCGWEYSPFSELQALPRDGRPINKWESTDEAYLNVFEGIKEAIEKIQNKQTTMVPDDTGEGKKSKYESLENGKTNDSPISVPVNRYSETLFSADKSDSSTQTNASGRSLKSNKECSTVSFYSYSNSRAPSTYIVKVSLELTKFGYNVLLIDWNFAQPNILTRSFKEEGPFRFLEGRPQLGLTDFIKKWDDSKSDRPPDFRQHFKQFSLKENPSIGRITFLPAVGEKWDSTNNFLKNLMIYNRMAMEKEKWINFKKVLQEDYDYDYILINSSTGLCSVEGLCNVQQPDIILFLYEIGEQPQICDMVVNYLNKQLPKKLLPILTRYSPIHCEFKSLKKTKGENEGIDEIVKEREEKHGWFKHLGISQFNKFIKFTRQTRMVVNSEFSEENFYLLLEEQKRVVSRIAALLSLKGDLKDRILCLLKNDQKCIDYAQKPPQAIFRSLNQENKGKNGWYTFDRSVESKSVIAVDKEGCLIIFAADDLGTIQQYKQKGHEQWNCFSQPFPVRQYPEKFKVAKRDGEFDEPVVIKDWDKMLLLFMKDQHNQLYFTRQNDLSRWTEWQTVGKGMNSVKTDGLPTFVMTKDRISLFYDFRASAALPAYTREVHERENREYNVNCIAVSNAIFRIDLDRNGKWSDPECIGIPPLRTKHKHGVFRPKAVSFRGENLVFARASDGTMWVYRCSTKKWHSLDGIFDRYMTTILSHDKKLLHVFHTGTDGTIYRRWLESPYPETWASSQFQRDTTNLWWNDLAYTDDEFFIYDDHTPVLNENTHKIELFALNNKRQLYRCHEKLDLTKPVEGENRCWSKWKLYEGDDSSAQLKDAPLIQNVKIYGHGTLVNQRTYMVARRYDSGNLIIKLLD